jgi:hypothetical protein
MKYTQEVELERSELQMTTRNKKPWTFFPTMDQEPGTATGRVPGHKIGRLWKFRKEEIVETVKSGLSACDEAQAVGATTTVKTMARTQGTDDNVK